jgi:endonuclease/exonuclease/phosphatase family metal-dependent hydrolase
MFSIASLNIHNMADRWLERRELMVKALLEAHPDLVALQEVRLSAGQAWWVCNQLNARLGQVVYTVAQQRSWRFWFGRQHGLAIISKLPIVAQDALALGEGGRVALRINVALPTGHLVDVVTTHLQIGPFEGEERLAQVMRLVGWLNERGRAPYQIIAGGFEDVPTSLAVTYMRQNYTSAYAQARGRDPLATWPTSLVVGDVPSACLDYLFITRTLAATAASLFATHAHPDQPTLFPSDHVGLFATLELRENG